jgi:hypothetical protein
VPKRQPGLKNSPAVLAWVAAKTQKIIPVLLATNFPVLKSTVVRESKCTFAQVNAPVFQCEGVVGLLVA